MRASSGRDGISTRTELHDELKGKDYRSFGKIFPFIAATIARITKEENTTSMTCGRTWYIEILSDVKGDMEQQAWSKKELGRLESTFQYSINYSMKRLTITITVRWVL